MNTTSYTYDIKINKGSDLFEHEPFSAVIPNCAEMVIKSKEFSTYAECESSFSQLLNALSTAETTFTSRNNVIVTRVNPNLDVSGKKRDDEAGWDKLTVMRAFVADAEVLKSSQIKYDIYGQIKVLQKNIDLTFSPRAQ
jgi:hypothetical protein